MTSPFHYEALLVTCTIDRNERRDAIRELGAEIYANHKTTSALHGFMQTAIDLRPDLTAPLLADFNSALDGIGHWMS